MASRIPFIHNPWFRRFFRGARALGLGAGVFAAGHFHGHMEYAKDPDENDEIQLRQFLHAHEVNLKLENGTTFETSIPYIKVFLSDHAKGQRLPPAAHQIPAFSHSNERGLAQVIPPSGTLWGERALALESVGTRVIKAAREVVDLGVQIAIFNESSDSIEARNAKTAFVEQLDEAELDFFERIANIDLDLERWKAAQRALNYQWGAIMIAEETVNAFFTPLVPRMIFVHEGLLANASNHDELAHVLGHEMSHMICGHVEDMIQFNATTSILQLIVISLLDPTGIMGFAGEFFLLMGSTLGLVTSAYSRQNEMQADELGLIITARACFDTDKAYRFFEHMKLQPYPTGYLDTHPSDYDRVKNLESAAAAMHLLTDHASCAPTAQAAKSFMHQLGFVFK
eukprot:m.137121 g.137121  ORF g.137121 m.137121 type:complete len:398 (-) comp11455_c0_seq1:1858-3051(-)